MSNSSYIYSLDLWRFLAVGYVWLSHGYNAWLSWTNNGAREINKSYYTFFQNGGFGVEIFFVLSGFLITYLMLQEKKKWGKINIKHFFIRRSLRIWPLYFVLIALTPLIVHYSQMDDPDYWPNLLFVNNFHAINIQNWQFPFGHFWSICVEEHFYLFWPFLLAFISVKHWWKIFVAVLILSMSVRFYYYFQRDTMAWWPIYLNTFCRIDTLAFGALIALYKDAWVSYFKPYMKWIGLMAFLLLLYKLIVHHHILYDTIYQVVFEKYEYLLLIGTIMLTWSLEGQNNYRSFLKPFYYLGKISFGIYMFHNVLFAIIYKIFLYRWEMGDSALMFWLVYLVLTLLLSSLSYHFLEKPFLKLKHKFSA